MIYADRYIPDQIRLTGRPPQRGTIFKDNESSLSDEIQDEIERLYKTGHSFNEVAEQTGISKPKLNGYYSARGWPKEKDDWPDPT